MDIRQLFHYVILKIFLFLRLILVMKELKDSIIILLIIPKNAKKIIELYSEYDKNSIDQEKELVLQKIDLVESQLNKFVYKIYNLTDDEIKLIGNGLLYI